MAKKICYLKIKDFAENQFGAQQNLERKITFIEVGKSLIRQSFSDSV